jgi:peroxiredoxin
MRIGDEATTFSLPATDGREYGPDGVTVVVFTCNHCPYALAWHDRLTQVAEDYDVTFLAINPNDAERYPRDSFDAMKERVDADGGWPHPYLHDESQEVARAYGAQTTPDVFVLDAEGILRYRGAPDADHRDEGQRAAWLRDALDAVLAGEQPQRPETEPVGCSIKWRQ